MLQGWGGVGGGALFAVSTRSPVSRSVTWPTAAVCRNQQRGGRWIGGLRGGSLQITTTDTSELFTLYKALPCLSSNRAFIATPGGRQVR